MIERTQRYLEPHRRLLRALITLLGLLLCGLLFWYLLRPFQGGEYDLWGLLGQLRWPRLVGMFALYGLALILAVFLWGSMMNQFGTPLPWRTHWYIYTTTNVTRRLPGSIWHVAGRALLYHQQGIARRATAVVSGLEMLLMLLGGALLLLVSGGLALPQVAGRWQGLLMMAGLLGALLLLLYPSNWQRLRALSGNITDKESLPPPLLFTWLLGYGMIWLLGGSVVFVLAAALVPLPWLAWPGTIGAWVLAGLAGLLIMILPSGLGVTELSLTLLLSAYMPPPIALLVALVTRLLLTLFELLFAVLTWLSPPFYRLITRK